MAQEALGQQMTSGISGEKDTLNEKGSFLDKLFGGGQFTGFGGDGETPTQRGLSIFGGPQVDPKDFLTGKAPSFDTKSFGDFAKSDEGLFAASLINDAFKRSDMDKLLQTQVATAPFAKADLVGLAKKGIAGFDPVTDFAEKKAIDDLKTRRDKQREQLMDILKRNAGGKPSLLKKASAKKEVVDEERVPIDEPLEQVQHDKSIADLRREDDSDSRIKSIADLRKLSR